MTYSTSFELSNFKNSFQSGCRGIVGTVAEGMQLRSQFEPRFGSHGPVFFTLGAFDLNKIRENLDWSGLHTPRISTVPVHAVVTAAKPLIMFFDCRPTQYVQ